MTIRSCPKRVSERPLSRRCTAITLALWLLLATMGCGGHAVQEGDDTALTAMAEAEDTGTEAALWADSLMHEMTLREMAAQLVMPAIYARAGEGEMTLLRRYAVDERVGGIVLLKGSFAEATALADSLAAWSRVMPFVAIDGEWGLNMRLTDAPRYPRNAKISREASENALYEYGYEMAAECRGAGINMLLGPVIDVVGGDMKGLRSAGRSFGEDPEQVARFGTAYARGLEDGNVVSVAKHFPGHGRTADDSHLRLPVIRATREELDSTDLLPFRAYSDMGMSAIMTGHLAVPSLDDSGRPATVSRRMLKDLLRHEIGFRGLIITDAMNMKAVSGYGVSDAIEAGADIVLAPLKTAAAIDELAGMDSLVIADRCRRVLERKYHLIGTLPARLHPDSLHLHTERITRSLTGE